MILFGFGAVLPGPAGDPSRHEIRAATGRLIAVHCRRSLPGGKKLVWWMGPDGQHGLRGLRAVDLPLYLSERAQSWILGAAVILVEGEPAADALAGLGYQAVATVTGADATPNEAPLTVLGGHDVVLWPDHDEPGRLHMDMIASRLWRVRSLRIVVWPEGAAAKADAANCDPEEIRNLLQDAIAMPVPPRPAPPPPPRAVAPTKSGPIQRFNDSVTVCDVLAAHWGSEAEPGKTVECPAHDDRSPSLSVFPDNRRVKCWSDDCLLNNGGRGRDAWDLHRLAVELGER